MSPVTITIAKLIESPAVVDKIDIFAGHHAIAPVLLSPDFSGCGIAVNRLYDERQDHNVHAAVMVTCLSSSLDKAEAMGEAVVGALRDGEEPWSHEEADDVQFEKSGPDVTGWDAARGQFFRSIEFSVSW